MSCSLSSSLSDSSLIRMACESSTVTRLALARPPPSLPKISPRLMAPICAPGMPGAQLLAEALARGRAGAGPDQSIDHALFRVQLGARLHVLTLSIAGERDGNLH